MGPQQGALGVLAPSSQGENGAGGRLAVGKAGQLRIAGDEVRGDFKTQMELLCLTSLSVAPGRQAVRLRRAQRTAACLWL